MRVLFVHGACVRDPAWWWHRMVAPLAALGLDSRAVELPSCAGPGPDLHADADAVRAALDEAPGEPAVLVGHSYGGMVITDAAAGRGDVHHLLYVTAVVPDRGESLADLAGPAPAPWVVPRGDGTVGPNPDADLRGAFLHDCDARTAQEAWQRWVPQSQEVFTQAPRAVAWHTVPATYVVCTGDRATPPARQREFAARLPGAVELSAGHHPFLTRPELLAQVVAAAAT